jgi:hypothetical protein
MMKKQKKFIFPKKETFVSKIKDNVYCLSPIDFMLNIIISIGLMSLRKNPDFCSSSVLAKND